MHREAIVVNFVKNEYTFAFLDKNRKIDLKNVEAKKESISKYGVLGVITVVRASDLKEEGFRIYNACTENEITDFADNVLVVTDGQHRITALNQLSKEATDAEKLKINVDIISLTDSSMQSICNYITEINNVSTKWTDVDYIEYACKMKPKSRILDIIKFLRTQMKFPMSTISRYLFADTDSLKNESLIVASDASNDEESVFPGIALERGIEIICMLLRLGFDMSYIKKRYLIDEINKIASKEVNWPLYFVGMTQDTVNKITKLSSDKIKDINTLLNKAVDKTQLKKPWEFDKSDAHLSDNIDYIKSELKKKEQKKCKSKAREPKLKDCK